MRQEGKVGAGGGPLISTETVTIFSLYLLMENSMTGGLFSLSHTYMARPMIFESRALLGEYLLDIHFKGI